MEIKEFNKQMIDAFYSRTAYDKEKVFVVLCEDLYAYALEHSPCEKHKMMIENNKGIVSNLNGMSFPKRTLNDGYYSIISKRVFSYKDLTYLGTYIHEITHAHDFAIFARYIGASFAQEIYDSKFYNCSMGMISEFNARRNGFSYVREKAYSFKNQQEEVEQIFSKEIPLIIDRCEDIQNLDNLAQLFGRMAVLDLKTNENARNVFYDYFAGVFNQFTLDRVIKIYEILYKYKDKKDNISFCTDEIQQIIDELL